MMKKAEAWARLEQLAKERGKTLKEFIDTDIKRMLEKAWDIQQRTGKPVSIDQLVKELNE